MTTAAPSEALISARIEVADERAAAELFLQRGWTDGLPIVAPTPELVSDFVSAVGRDPVEVLGEIPEQNQSVTVQKLAVNAVMAGCRPDYMAPLVATVRALTREPFNLHSTTVSGATAALLIVRLTSPCNGTAGWMSCTVTLTGVFLGCKHAIPAMIQGGGGAIINTAVVEGRPWQQHWHAGIRCNAVAPGLIETPATEQVFAGAERRDWLTSKILVGRAGQPVDIANAVLYLAREESSYMTGQTIVVDDGRLIS